MDNLVDGLVLPGDGLKTLPDFAMTTNVKGVEDGHLADLGLSYVPARERDILKAVIGNAVAAIRMNRWAHYPRSPNDYSGQSRYEGEHYSLRRVLRAIDILLDLSLIEEQRSFPGRRGQRSRFRAAVPLQVASNEWGSITRFIREPIQFKDGRKKRIDYTDTPRTCRMRREMKEINQAIGGLRLGLPPGIDHTVKVLSEWARGLYRVFNEDIEHGGRAYGGFWQNLSKQTRACLTIDGDPVVESDFPQLHAQLGHATLRKDLQGDAYEIPGCSRVLAKVGWQILMNAVSRREAVEAFARQLRKADGALPATDSAKRARELLRRLEERHREISPLFYSGVGLRLQRVDADLMVRIMLRCMGKGIVPLPVHDSFIVRRADDAFLGKVMDDELRHVLQSLRTGHEMA